jgi:cardiolipin synthase
LPSATPSASSAPERGRRRRWLSRLWGTQRFAGDPVALYLLRPERLSEGNRVRLLDGGGESFPAMLAAIAAARSEVLLAMYIVRDDAIGLRFREALIERARAGVSVSVCYDALGCLGTAPDSWFDPLAEAGCRVLEYHPLAPWLPKWGFNRRNHQKILVVDGEVGFTGGLNLANEYAPEPEGGGWVDLMVRVEGPAASELGQVFVRAWRLGGGTPFVPLDVRARAHPDGTRVQTLDNIGLARRYDMHLAWRHAIAGARSSITIANAYFIPDRALRRALRSAVRRGVRVDVVMPSRSDVPPVQMAARHLYRRLLRAGVRLYELDGPMMHAKAAVIDRLWSTIGSYNLDRRSFLHNLEAGLVVFDPPFGDDLCGTLTALRERSREITLADVAARGPLQRLASWFAFLFRYWL